MNIKGKNVLVTGSEGFIGSHLTERLVEMGANVMALVQYNSFNNWGWIDTFHESVKRQVEVFTGDIREYDCIKKAVKGRDIVFHLAALIAIPYSYTTPLSYVRTNIEGTLNILQCCLDFEVCKMMHTSTSEVYGTAVYTPIDESHPLSGQSPYSASKIGADKLVESFYRSFNLPVTTLRPFNNYGPRQSARAVIPTIISQILSGKNSIKLGSLTPTRDFTFVKDTVEAFIRAAEVDESIGETINIGSNREISIGNLVNKLEEITGKSITVEVVEDRIRPDKSEVNRLLCNNKKALEMLSWKPETDLDTGLRETVAWVDKNLSYYKTDIYNK
ncbi:MAG: NAD-dependent 4,6-dehydratase LegB [Bacillota bacterium]|nr:NAD-dependent 4,6-dehydratase LegB [Bacillota bacterium]